MRRLNVLIILFNCYFLENFRHKLKVFLALNNSKLAINRDVWLFIVFTAEYNKPSMIILWTVEGAIVKIL